MGEFIAGSPTTKMKMKRKMKMKIPENETEKGEWGS
jgi:uncharacterized membrane protein